jgi:ABC-type phosphate/phosphonate transport system substrate-binding protein
VVAADRVGARRGLAALCGADEAGEDVDLVRGVAGAEVRVIATFGAIPPDVIATRKTLAAGVQAKIWEALEKASATEDGQKLLSAVFGGDGVQSGLAKSYSSLQRALDVATKRGLFD